MPDFPDNPVALIADKITEGINHAADMLDAQNLMIASATLHSTLTMKIPGLPGMGEIVNVTNEITITIGPNPYKVNQ